MIAYQTHSDQEILAFLKAGDEGALTYIYKTYWDLLFLSAHNILKDPQTCEDIIQDIFIKLWDKRKALEINISFKAYLFASCRYALYRQIKLNNVREDIFDQLHERLQAPSAYGSLEYRELVQQIKTIVDTLPEKCREVYKLSREENLSHKEIAERLNISTKTVENHITKALGHLRGSLGGLLTLEVIIWLMKD